MFEMSYQYQRELFVLDRGKYKGFEYKIISYGTHPCCYVAIPENHKFYNKNYDDIDINCHGGLTYSAKEEDGKYWIGWDYAHYGDYIGVNEHPFFKGFDYSNEKKWTTKELKKEVKKFIEKL